MTPGLGAIDVPILMVQGNKDTTCLNKNTRRLADEIGDKVIRFTEKPEWSHMEFITEIANPEYFEMLVEQLEYVKISQMEAVQWAINRFIEEKDREAVAERIDLVQERLEDVDEAGKDAMRAFRGVQQAGMQLQDAVNDLFMQDGALQASAAIAAIAAMSAF